MKRLILLFWTVFTVSLYAGYAAPLHVDGSKLVDSKEAYALYQQGVTFVDVRPQRFVTSGMIKGAHHLYVGAMTPQNIQKVAAKDAAVVVYCNGVSCSLTAEAIVKMTAWGYSKIYYYRDGFPAWKYYKLPMQ
jgi:rhodanese-related sulfurtransferase